MSRLGPALVGLLSGCLVVCCLSGCVSVPAFHLPRPAAATAPAPTAAPPPCPGGLMAELAPAPAIPPQAGFPAPSTDAERQAVSSYLEWLRDYAVWSRAGRARAADARAFCAGR